MTAIQTAIVAGGGIAGPATALALRLLGVEVTVYEAHPRTADGVGGTIAFAPNGLAALRVLGVDEGVRALATPLANIYCAIGRKSIPMPSLPDLPPQQVIRRSDIYRVVRDRAVAEGVRIEYGRRLVDARETAAGITVTFADGGTASADVLIGADGVHSTVRRLIDPDAARPDYTGMLGFEAVARHRVDLPPDTGIFAFDTGVHYRCMPSPGGTSWSANLHWKRPMTSAEARAVPAEEWLRRLYDAFDDDDLGREFMRTTDPAGLQIVGPLYAMPPVRHWHRGRMVLVGDAVHAPSNVSGQGASLAVESAVQLARCLRDLPDVPAAFAAYERLRRRRVETIAARATRRIKRLTPSGPATRSMLQTLVPLMLKTVLTAERTLAPEQRHDIDWDAPVSAKPIAC